MKDWMIRAIKTFVQAFFGVLIPEICAMLRNGWPEDWKKVWVILAPVIAAALAAAIAAVWNIILEALHSAPNEADYPEWKEDVTEYTFRKWDTPEHETESEAKAEALEAEVIAEIFKEEYAGKHAGGQKDE